MNAEQYEQAMDAQFAVADTIWRTCLYDSVSAARSEARYEETDADRETEDAERARRGAGAPESAPERTEP